MSRKNILIAIGIVVAGIILYKITKIPPITKVWVDNQVSASYTKGTINEPMGSMPSTAEIYIDASGSMKPYFKSDGTNMINTISEIYNLNQKGTKIYFLDNPVPYSGLVENIITNINKQPNLSATTFHKFFERAANQLDTVNTLIYIVTDGIMSVGAGDTKKALVQLRGAITNALEGHRDLAGAVFRYVGEYNGDYWNCKNQRVTLKQPMMRPYYVIALGRKDAMRWLQTVSSKKLNNPKEYFMGLHDFAGHAKPTLAYGDSTRIEDINKTVSLILDLPDCLKDIDAAKVKVINANNQLPVNVVNEGTRLVAEIPPTQVLRPETDGRIKIQFIAKNEIPVEWLETWDTEDDGGGPDEITTYSLKYLVKGMFDGLEGEQDLINANFIYKRQ